MKIPPSTPPRIGTRGVLRLAHVDGPLSEAGVSVAGKVVDPVELLGPLELLSGSFDLVVVEYQKVK
jgi:hypothetical protein